VAGQANAAQSEYWNSARHWVEDVAGHDDMLEPLGRLGLDALAPRPGERILDIGCGTGATTRALASAVGPGGEAVGADVSGLLLRVARERGGGSFVQADAQTYPFEPNAFDGAFSRLGVMFFDDPVAAFGNIRSALRPGGRFVFVCWQAASDNEWWAVPAAATAAWVDGSEADGGPGPFSLADGDRLRRTLTEAGFADVELRDERRPVLLGGHGDLETAVGYLRASRFGKQIRESSDPEAALAAVRDALAPYATQDGVKMTAAVWLATARRPA
jgi:SAM-dependent methyltransferase